MGCLGGAGPEEGRSTAFLQEGDSEAVEVDGFQVSLGPLAPLPDRFSTEPSIAVQADGDVAVSGLATDADPTVSYLGGYVWVSTDRGRSFTLERDRAVPAERPVGCAGCDTTLVARDGRFVLGTFHAEVNPDFDVSVAISNEDGSSWRTLDPGAAEEQPIDRPWLATANNGTLLLLYRHQPGATDRVDGSKIGNVYAQWGPGTVGSWSSPSLVISPDEGDRDRAVSFGKPEILETGRALVPLQVTDESRNGFVNYTNHVAVGGADEDGWRLERISPPQPVWAAFDYSLDANENGTVVAAWTQPSAPDGTHQIHVRVSRDDARTWGPTRIVPTPGTAMQPWVAVREDGLAAVSYHGSDHEGRALDAPEDTAWWPRTVLFETRAPTEPIAVAQLQRAPIYTGLLCNGSPACPEDDGRVPMREFLSAAWDPGGSLYTAYTNATAEDDEDPGEMDGLEGGRLMVRRLDVDAPGEGRADAGIANPPSHSALREALTPPLAGRRG